MKSRNIKFINWISLSLSTLISLTLIVGGIRVYSWSKEGLFFVLLGLSVILIVFYYTPLYIQCHLDSIEQALTIKKQTLFQSKLIKVKVQEIVQVQFNLQVGDSNTYNVSLLLQSGQSISLTESSSFGKGRKKKLAECVGILLSLPVVEKQYNCW